MFKTRSISQLEKSLARTQAGLQEQNDLLSWLSGYVEESNEFKEFNNSAIIDQEVKYENRLNHLQDQYDLLEIEKDCDVEEIYRLRKDNELIEQYIDRLQLERDKLKTINLSHMEKISRLEKQYKHVYDLKANVEQDRNNLEATCDTLNDALKEMKNEKNFSAEKMLLQVEKLNAKLSNVTKDLMQARKHKDHLTHEVKDYIDKNSILKFLNQSLNENIEILNNKAKSMQTELLTFRTKNHELVLKYNAFEQKFMNLNEAKENEIIALNEDILVLETKMNQLKHLKLSNENET